jgi:hypothetical protein
MRRAIAGLTAALALAGCAAEGTASTGCASALRAEADAESFRAAGRDASAQRLAALARDTGARFAAAAAKACADGALSASAFADYDRLLVQNGEGASEPVLYEEPLEFPRTLILQYLFESGGAPAEAEIAEAFRCWREPDSEECYHG